MRARSMWVVGLAVVAAVAAAAPAVAEHDSDLPVSTASVTGLPPMSERVFASADLTGDGRVDLVAHPRGEPEQEPLWVYRGSGRGGFFSGRSTLGSSSWLSAIAPGPVVQGKQTFRAVDPSSNGGLLITLGVGDDGWFTLLGPWTGTCWSVMSHIDQGFDLTGDGLPDLVAMDQAGALWTYPAGIDGGRLRTRIAVGRGWSSMRAVFSAGDLTGDGRADIGAVDQAGSFWVYPGRGAGRVGSRVLVGHGWGAFGAVIPLRDFTGDGRPDIGAIDATGRFWLYAGAGSSRLRAPVQIGSGWQAFL